MGRHCRLEAEDLLRYINVLFILGCTDSARQLASVMPVYSYEKYTNGLNFSLHHDEPLKEAASRGHHHTGGGLSFGQQRTLEERNLFTEEDLR